MQFTKLTGTAVPAWTASFDDQKHRFFLPADEDDLPITVPFDPRKRPAYRGVSISRLPVILSTGIDVEPTTATIFTGDFQKATEYGGLPKVIMALDRKRLDRTYKKVPADTPADEIAELRRDYPNRLDGADCADDTSIWLTRLPADNPCAGAVEEKLYCRWIPGNPLDALVAVFVFQPEQRRGDPASRWAVI